MKMKHVEIPDEFNRNAPNIQALWIENTGLTLIKYASELLDIQIYQIKIFWMLDVVSDSHKQ